MRERSLLILSSGVEHSLILRKLNVQDSDELHICALDYESAQFVSSLQDDMRQKRTTLFKIVDYLDRFNQESLKLKECYLEFIHQISEVRFSQGINFKEFFRYPASNFSVWWFSSIAEKNPYQTKTFHYFVQALTIASLKKELGCDRILFFGKEAKLLEKIYRVHNARRTFLYQTSLWILLIEALRVIKFLINTFGKMLDVKFLALFSKNRREALSKCKIAFITMFPHLDEGKLEQGKYINLAYGPLQYFIPEAEKKNIIWLGMYAPVKSYRWRDAVRFAKKIKNIDNFFLLEEWLKFGDLWNIIRNYMSIALRAFMRIREYEACFTFNGAGDIGVFHFWEVFKKDLFSSFFGKVLIWRITDFVTFSNIARDLPLNSTLVHFAEFHSWERALKLACTQRSDLHVIGLQHTSLPLLWLNYFHHSEELRGNDYLQHAPVPDAVGCVGRIPRDIFVKNGWSSSKIFIEGGFRFDGLKCNSRESVQGKKNHIVVAFSLSPQANKEFLLLLRDAFQHKEIDFDVLLKCHPLDPLEKIACQIGFDTMHGKIRFTNEPLEVVVPKSKAMIVRESSAVFWAIRWRVPIIVPYLHSFIDLCPLTAVSNLATYVKTSEELRRIANSFVKDEVFLNELNSQIFLSEYLDIYNDKKQYFDNLARSRESVQESVLA